LAKTEKDRELRPVPDVRSGQEQTGRRAEFQVSSRGSGRPLLHDVQEKIVPAEDNPALPMREE
jgi:hypothetical protein